MAYVVLRFSKQKGNPAARIEAHHERTKEEYKSNPDIDTSKSKNNIHLITPQMRYKAEVDTSNIRGFLYTERRTRQKQRVLFIIICLSAYL